jgi:hypothetical protein
MSLYIRNDLSIVAPLLRYGTILRRLLCITWTGIQNMLTFSALQQILNLRTKTERPLLKIFCADFFLTCYIFTRSVAASSLAMSVRPSAWNNSSLTGLIFMKFGIWVFLEILSRKFNFKWYSTKITGNLREDVFTFMNISRWILFRKRNVSDESYRGKQNTHFLFFFVTFT